MVCSLLPNLRVSSSHGKTGQSNVGPLPGIQFTKHHFTCTVWISTGPQKAISVDRSLGHGNIPGCLPFPFFPVIPLSRKPPLEPRHIGGFLTRTMLENGKSTARNLCRCLRIKPPHLKKPTAGPRMGYPNWQRGRHRMGRRILRGFPQFETITYGHVLFWGSPPRQMRGAFPCGFPLKLPKRVPLK